MSTHDDLTFGTLDVHADDADSRSRLHAYADAWSSAFIEGRLDDEKFGRWLEHSREDDVTLRHATPTHSAVGATPRPVATFSSWRGELNVGGPELVPLHMISDVTVAPTHRRRGILSRLMTEDLAVAAADGAPIAALTVSEGSIYGRFGFGPATRYRQVEVDIRPGRLRLRPGFADDGSLEQLLPGDAWPLVQRVKAEHLRRTRGEVSRPAFYRQFQSGDFDWETGGINRRLVAIVHLDVDGTPDGYVLYTPKEGDDHDHHRIDIGDLIALTPAAELRLWEYLAGVDLLSVARARLLHDDPLDHAVVDPRCVKTTLVRDMLWVRLLDLPRTLGARPWREDGSVVLDVADPLGHVSGRWRLTTAKGIGTLEPSTETADVHTDVETLGTLYLGDVPVHTVAAAGRLTGTGVDTFAAMADHAGPSPYCRTGF
ncbi:GNAT family N-acetyltransferase [Nocardioides acrostichi]|uniref:GNAT family N-acetyltransferase n=1 Tax=Nocardioides acrostichi TaxID=2784339 RepID=A0A930Y5U2_9ACTN|nr:GNAT family N-acetyltransferase [Nocardioides acrostichi]MBF4160236.1 GNAT family N-acetyltransferase [Nocardioides acrostichi]